MHHWFLRKVYPHPQLAIFLDAPAGVLYERKQELPTEYLESDRAKLLANSSYAGNFVQVDATQSVEEVLADVIMQIERYELDTDYSQATQ